MTPKGEPSTLGLPYVGPMTEEQINPDRIDDANQPADDVAGTTDGVPTAGVELSEDEHDQSVEPDDNAFEVDGPQAGHA